MGLLSVALAETQHKQSHCTYFVFDKLGSLVFRLSRNWRCNERTNVKTYETQVERDVRTVVVLLYRRFGTTFLDFLTLEDGTDKLSRNVGTELPLYAA